MLAEVEPDLVSQWVDELKLGTSIQLVCPEEQLRVPRLVSMLGLVDTDGDLVAHSEAADVPRFLEHHGETQSCGVELAYVVEQVSCHVEGDVVELGHAPTVARPVRRKVPISPAYFKAAT